MRLTSRPSRSLASSESHSRPQMTLMTFQPAPRNAASSSWMIWPLPRTGPSSRCRLQLMTKIRLSSFSRDGSVMAPSASGSSVSPSPRNAQTFALDLRLQAAVLQVADEPRLVNRHDGAEAHRHASDTPRSPASATDAGTTTGRRPASVRGGNFRGASRRCALRGTRARRCRAPHGPERRPGRRRPSPSWPRKKWLKPTSYSVAAEAYVEM